MSDSKKEQAADSPRVGEQTPVSRANDAPEAVADGLPVWSRLLDQLDEPVLVCRHDGSELGGWVVFANRAIGKWLGRSSEELAGQPAAAIMDPPPGRALPEPGQPQEISARFRHAEGRVLSTRLKMSRLDLDGETLLLATAAPSNLAAWSGIEAGLDGHALEALEHGAALTDDMGLILASNQSFSSMMHQSAAEVRGRHLISLFPEQQDQTLHSAAMQAVQSTGFWRGAVTLGNNGGPGAFHELSLRTIRNAQGQSSHMLALLRAIREDDPAAEQFTHLAHHDTLTGLPNRTLFNNRLNSALSHAKRRSASLAILFLDLDNFKTINDSLGHSVGDKLLTGVAGRLLDCVREEDTVSRLGGDEFIILLVDVKGAAGAVRVASRILAKVADPVVVEGRELHVSASIGITLFPEDGDDAETLIKNADMAMYQAKAQGKRSYHLYTTAMNTKVNRRLVMENNLRKAFQRGEFLTFYQPKVSAVNGHVEIVGMEALLRWNRPELGLVGAGEIIPLAEETGLIVPIGEWVLRQACLVARDLHDAGRDHVCVAVNLSARQLLWQHDLVDMVESVLDETGLPAAALELEVTESAIMHNVDASIEIMHQLRGLGIRLAMDDFGTGYSSLAYLKRFPLDVLKIDRSFVKELPGSHADSAIVAGIISMARSLELEVVAEGVETRPQMEFLKMQGCSLMQGYLFSPPVPTDDFLELFNSPLIGES